MVAQLTLFFWKRLYSDDYAQALWRTALKRVFPDKALQRPQVAAHLERIYQTRNRIAHHEPVYGRRLADTLLAIDFVLAKFGTPDTSGTTPIGHLLEAERKTVIELASALEARLAELRTPVLQDGATKRT